MVRRTKTERIFRSDLSQMNGTLYGYILGIPPYPGWIEVENDSTGERILYQWHRRVTNGGEYVTPDGKLRLVAMHTEETTT